MSDIPPPLTDAELRALIVQSARDAARAAASGDIAVQQGRLIVQRLSNVEHRLSNVEQRVDGHDGRLLVLERERTRRLEEAAGVDEIPIDVAPIESEEDPIPSHLSPPPDPPRAPMSTHEQLETLATAQTETASKAAAIEAKTDKQTTILDDQTTMLQKLGAQQRSVLAAFIGAILMAMINQCQPATIQAWLPHRAGAVAPVTAQTTPAKPGSEAKGN